MNGNPDKLETWGEITRHRGDDLQSPAMPEVQG